MKHGEGFSTAEVKFGVANTFNVGCCHMGTAIKHRVPDRVKASFVIFDIWAFRRLALSVRALECPDVKNCKRRFTRSGTWCFIAIRLYGNSGRQGVFILWLGYVSQQTDNVRRAFTVSSPQLPAATRATSTKHQTASNEHWSRAVTEGVPVSMSERHVADDTDSTSEELSEEKVVFAYSEVYF